MNCKSAKWFEVIVKYIKDQQDGTERGVKEIYVFDAQTFAEAEKKAFEELQTYVSDGELMVVNINPAKYGEVWFSDDNEDDKYYRVQLCFFLLDEATGKEKKSKTCYLVQACDTAKVQKHIEEIMGRSMMTYEVMSIVDANIEDVYVHNVQAAR